MESAEWNFQVLAFFPMATDYRKWDNFDDSDSDDDASAASGSPTKKTEVGKKSVNRDEQAALLKAKARKAEADAVLEAVNNSRGSQRTTITPDNERGGSPTSRDG